MYVSGKSLWNLFVRMAGTLSLVMYVYSDPIPEQNQENKGLSFIVKDIL